MKAAGFLAAFLCVYSSLAGEPTSVQYDSGTLAMEWGNGTDWFRMLDGNDGYIRYTWEGSSNFFGPGQHLLDDQGNKIPSGLTALFMDMGDGSNRFLSPSLEVSETFFFLGGNDDDIVNPVHGDRLAYFFLGPGNDQFVGSNTDNNWVWTQAGDDQLHATFSGTDFLDGGSGDNQFTQYADSLSTFYHWPGASDVMRDNLGGDTNYILVPGSTPSELTVIDEGGIDSIDLGGHSFDVIAGVIDADSITGYFEGWPVEVVTGEPGGGSGIPEPASWVLAGLCAVISVLLLRL